jgi:L-amino acid N-acyltransferase YncA
MEAAMSIDIPKIRPVQEADASPIVGIYAPYVRETAISFEIEPPSEAAMGQRIVNTMAMYPWLVAEQDDQIVGYAYASKHRERPAYRWSVDVTVYVDRGTHRRGIGRALYRPLVELLRGQGFRSAFAEIALPNVASVRLHEAMGFKQVGVHRDAGFKLGSWHDVGYWRLGLAEDAAPPDEPSAFPIFRTTSAFSASLRN